MSDQYESIRDIGTRLIALSERVRLYGVTPEAASTLDNAAGAIRAHAVAQRQALQAAEQLAAAEAADA